MCSGVCSQFQRPSPIAEWPGSLTGDCMCLISPAMFSMLDFADSVQNFQSNLAPAFR